MVGQIYLPANSRVARLSFLLCEDFSASAGVYALIEFLSYQAGENQALNLVAEVENNPGLFEMLRRAGFSAFGIETVWKLAVRPDKPELSSSWKNAIDKDEIGIRSLYQAVTPPLEQGAELTSRIASIDWSIPVKAKLTPGLNTNRDLLARTLTWFYIHH